MFKKFTRICLFVLCPFFTLMAQPWMYDFGTDTGTYNTPGQSETFLPLPANGTALVAVSFTGGGAFYLENPGIIGSDSELRIAASSIDSVNKFSIISINSAAAFTINFDIHFEGGDSGTFFFFNGFNSGGSSTTFTGTTNASGPHVFSGLRWDFGEFNTITTYFRNITEWDLLGTGNTFSKGANFTVEIYSNNTNEAIEYFYNTPQSVASYKWDLWVNGTLVGDDLTKALLADDNNMNSFTFHARNSLGNTANLHIDNIIYTNEIAQIPLPVDDDNINILGKYELSQNYPNPFNPSTKIRWQSPVSGWQTLKIYDVLGNEISTLLDEFRPAGNYELLFETSGLSSGVYFYRLVAGEFAETKKMTLLR